MRVPTFVLLTALQTALFTPLFTLGVAWVTQEPLETSAGFLLRVGLVGVVTAADLRDHHRLDGGHGRGRPRSAMPSRPSAPSGRASARMPLPEPRGDALGRVARAVNAAGASLDVAPRRPDPRPGPARSRALRHGRGRHRRQRAGAGPDGQRGGAGSCCGSTPRPSAGSYVELIRHPDIAMQITQALQGQRPGGLELAIGRDPARRSSRAAHRRSRQAVAARCSCCTTSPTCDAPTASGATSSPTCRTNCARR